MLIDQHFQHQPISIRDIESIVVRISGTEITTIIVHRAIFISLTSEVILQIIDKSIIILNLDLRTAHRSSVFSCQCHCLQSVITLIDISDGHMSLGKLHLRHMC